jgi:adenylosuccinate synthase
MTNVHIVAGGQYGSEAKGHLVAQLVNRLEHPPVAVRVGGPNAGHTIYTNNGTKLVFRSIPCGIAHPDATAIVAAGSEIDIDVLKAELQMLDHAGIEWASRLFIDSEATIITEQHKQTELDNQYRTRFGSTAKGIGAARAARLQRQAPRVRDLLDDHPILRELHMDNTHLLSNAAIFDNQPVIVEGTQGYGLGINAGHYPYCTAGNCRTVDFAAQAGIPAGVPTTSWLVFRTYPIRVAGNSGPMHNETDWDHLHNISDGYITPEQTTVTKLTRRVGHWDHNLARAALDAHGHPHTDTRAVLMFVDYLDPQLAGVTDIHRVTQSPAWAQIRAIETRLELEFEAFGTGPATMVWR